MERILKYGGAVYKLLGRQEYYPNTVYIPSRFCVSEKVADGYLVYHTLTREMLLMTDEEYHYLFRGSPLGESYNYRHLVRHWYLIENGIDETSLCRTLDHIYRHANRRDTIDKIEHYTILTTMSCNARCPYCYEHERKKRSMSRNIAGDVAAYITRTAMPRITLSWFGGEPLINPGVITLICRELKANEIPFRSTMVSNGYLFNDMNVDAMLETWNLQRVQITMDGTEERYNKVKAYIYPDADGYKRVLNNIDLLLSAGIKVDIRMNLSKDNADDMEALADVLQERFAGRGLGAYAWPLFEGEGDPPLVLTDAERSYVYGRYIRLQDHLVEIGLAGRYNLSQIKPANCMSDNGKSVVIMPEGSLSVCEHHSDDELIGSIYGGTHDTAVLESWRERLKIPECRECILLPQCTKLKKCSTDPCCRETRQYTEHRMRQAMIYEYERRTKDG